VLLALPAGASAATTYQVVAKGNVYVRNKPSGFVIGTVFPGDRVDVQAKRADGWAYGRIRDSFATWRGRRCGWVLVFDTRRHRQKLLRSTGKRARSACPRSSGYLHEHRILKPGSYFDHYGAGGTFRGYVVSCSDPRAYGNFSPDRNAFSHPYSRPMPVGRGLRGNQFGVRYRTAHGDAVMILDTGNPAGAPAWFFMRRECVSIPSVLIGRQAPDNAPNVGQSGSPLTRPATLHASPGTTVRRARWRFWGAPTARGTGSTRAATCDPNCATGGSRTFRGVKIRLSGRAYGSCRGALVVFYTKVRYVWPKAMHRKDTVRRLHRSCEPYA
jgi:hypothetical protein